MKCLCHLSCLDIQVAQIPTYRRSLSNGFLYLLQISARERIFLTSLLYTDLKIPVSLFYIVCLPKSPSLRDLVSLCSCFHTSLCLLTLFDLSSFLFHLFLFISISVSIFCMFLHISTCIYLLICSCLSPFIFNIYLLTYLPVNHTFSKCVCVCVCMCVCGLSNKKI